MFSLSDLKKQNLPLLLLLSAIPLQNIYIGRLPNFGMGINFINVSLLLSIVFAFSIKKPKLKLDNTLKVPLILFSLLCYCLELKKLRSH